MIPRVFVSSTYYDLKHVRERLEKFIDNYGFEPVLFESDKVTYQYGKEIDQSAYYEVGLCHIMILIVGGRYGAPSSQARIEEERKRYDEDYISITRSEFETARSKNIPALIFIDKNVYSEYQTYKENQEFLDDLPNTSYKETKGNKIFKYAHVDHVNVFKFIDIVRSKPIKTFEKVEEIENYMKAQLSGMFYLYLESLKRSSEEKKILDTIAELNNVTLRMNEMLTSVGKEILGQDKGVYEKVIKSQFGILVDFYKEKVSSNLSFEKTLTDDELKQIDLNKASKVIYEKALKIEIPKIPSLLNGSDWMKHYREINSTIMHEVQNELLKISDKLIISKFEFRTLNVDLHAKVLPFMKLEEDEQRLIKGIEAAVTVSLEDLPF